MVEIIFQNKDDARKFHSFLQPYLSPFHLKNNLLILEDPNIGKVKIHQDAIELKEAFKEGFYQFILNIKLNDWLRSILKEQFYYEDEEEQQQIIDIIQSILDGDRVELTSFLGEVTFNRQLEEAICEMFQKHASFSFDSFMKFRMRPFRNQLEKYVEISIDEYKMEQEYQMFIQTLRLFLNDRRPKIKHLHLLMNEGVTFFDERFDEIRRSELIGMIDRKLLFNHPVYVDSVTIAPLLSIAPLTIYLYTNDREQPLLRTIQNIFEERVEIKSVSSFYRTKNDFPYTTEEKM